MNNLLPPDICAQIPSLYFQTRVADPIVYAKLFTPFANWTWFVLEYDGEDICFGLVLGLEEEFGYFSLEELNEAGSQFLPALVERDVFFSPQPLSQAKRALKGE
jgi:Protein of unknown function (DUF2958)